MFDLGDNQVQGTCAQITGAAGIDWATACALATADVANAKLCIASIWAS